MPFGGAGELVLQVLADSALDEFAAGRRLDPQEPGQDKRHEDGRAGPPEEDAPPVAALAAGRPGPDPCAETGIGCDHRADRALNEEDKPRGGPEQERHALGLVTPHIEAGERADTERGQEDEHAIRLGDVRLAGEQQRRTEQGSTDKTCAPPDQRHAAPEAGERGQGRAEPAGHAIGPYLLRFCAGEQGGRAGLQPVDARRLLVAQLVLVAQADIIARFQHLLGGLRKAALVAVERGQVEHAGRGGPERDHEEQDPGFPAGRDTVEKCHGFDF